MTALPPDVKADLREENARLKDELRTVRDRQTATSEILHTIAGTSGDAERALQRIAEITERLFSASSVSLHIADGERWGRTIWVGVASARIAAAIPLAHVAVNPQFMPGAVCLENRQVHVADTDDPTEKARWPGLAPARAAGTRTMSGTPLRREGHAIGALIVHRARLAPFTEDELALLQSFADQAVIAIENARLFNETREALERQTATADVLKVISRSAFDLQAVLDTLVESAGRLCEAEEGTIFQPRDGVYRLSAARGLSPETREFLLGHSFVPGKETTIGRVLLEGRTAHVPDVQADPNYRLSGDPNPTGARLGIPLLRQGVPIGVFVLARRNARPFTDKQIELVQTFADQAVIAIENTRLFDEVQTRTRDLTESLRQQTATADVLKVISRSAFDLQAVFDTLLSSAVALIGASGGSLCVREGDVFPFRATVNSSPEFVRYLADHPATANRQSITGRVIVSGEVEIIPDMLKDGEYALPVLLNNEIYRSGLGVPLLRNETVEGVIVLVRTQPGPFEPRQIELVKTFADQAVIAIENTRLFNETKEALERQTATADILKVIASSPSDVQPVFEAIAERSKRLVDALSTTVFRLVDGVMYLRAFTSTTPEADASLKALFPAPLSNFSWGEAVSKGEIFRVVDTEQEIDAMRNLARLRGFRSMLFVPLLRDRIPIGVIAVTRVEPGPFVEHHVQLLQTFADQAVIAIENVRLFDEVQAKTRDLTESLQQQTATADVLKVISRSAFDLQTVFNTLTESAARLCEADSSHIYLVDGDVAKLAACSGFSKEYEELLRGRPLAPGRGTLVGRTLLEGRVVHLPDAVADKEYLFHEAQRLGRFRTMLGVPMLRDGVTIGVLAVTRSEVLPFAEKQIALLQTFSDQAVIAIENARLFDEVQARTRELAKSLDDLRTAQDRLVQTEKLASLGQLTAGIAHEIKNPLNFVNNFAALSAELTNELNDLLKSASLAEKTREEVGELTGLLKENLEKVVQHGKRADSIVKNMLLHSREGSGEHRPADINALLEESLNLAYHGARAEKPQFNVTLHRDFDETAGTIEVFPQEITRVFLNLISNGFYAVTRRKTENGNSGFEPTVSATTRNLGHAVEIRIRDNGTGIPPEVKEKMFNPFFTTKPAGEGTGLGLSMSHDIIVKQHGGRIDVETEPGEFTEFTVILPRTTNPANKSEN